MRSLTLTIFLSFLFTPMMASPLDSLEALLRDYPQVQEKVYVHTDNTCYFLGDTLWYKAYVVRSDNLRPTTLSRLLYVDLLTPDGYLVERQHLQVDSMGCAWGQFAIEDSLYSGFYELRAYTRWQLNFNVIERKFTNADRDRFVDLTMANEFFTDWEGLYSRVLPFYEKPDSAGAYMRRIIRHRPLQRLPKPIGEELDVQFYPEGGTAVSHANCRIAFEARDGEGRGVDVTGRLDDGTEICSQHLGMGTFTLSARSDVRRAYFTWHGKEFSYRLPEVLHEGASMSYDEERHTLTISRLSSDSREGAVSISCRGRVLSFERIDSMPDVFTLNLEGVDLPVGVCEATLYNASAVPVATRMFFVDWHDMGRPIEAEYAAMAHPYERLTLRLNAAGGANMVAMSVAVRDAGLNAPSFDDGNMLTDLLLSSELRGFVANPSHYFDEREPMRRRHLDLLMMVQGWRKYKRAERLRYAPERALTYEGRVYRLPSWVHVTDTADFKNTLGKTYVDVWEYEEAERITAFDNAIQWDSNGGVKTNRQIREEQDKARAFPLIPRDVQHALDVKRNIADRDMSQERPEQTYGSILLDKPVLIDLELTKGGDVAKGVRRTMSDGRFRFSLPDYEDYAMLFVKSYRIKDSLRYTTPGRDREWNNELAYPKYYVKRDAPMPHFCSPYSWYQTHEPEQTYIIGENGDTIRLTGKYVLDNVDVNIHQRTGRRRLQYGKPAMVYDVYDLFNEATDNGLMCGVFDMYRFPEAVTTLLLGSSGKAKTFNVRAMMNGTTFYRNYTQGAGEYDKTQTDKYFVETEMRLSHLRNVRIYTDYNLRNGTGAALEAHHADVTLVFEPLPSSYMRYTYRDRRYVFPGRSTEVDFYHPDYSAATPEAPCDYRRTLYWNPNALTDGQGHFSCQFYGKSVPCQLKVSVCGINASGDIYFLQEEENVER